MPVPVSQVPLLRSVSPSQMFKAQLSAVQPIHCGLGPLVHVGCDGSLQMTQAPLVVLRHVFGCVPRHVLSAARHSFDSSHASHAPFLQVSPPPHGALALQGTQLWPETTPLQLPQAPLLWRYVLTGPVSDSATHAPLTESMQPAHSLAGRHTPLLALTSQNSPVGHCGVPEAATHGVQRDVLGSQTKCEGLQSFALLQPQVRVVSRQ